MNHSNTLSITLLALTASLTLFCSRSAAGESGSTRGASKKSQTATTAHVAPAPAPAFDAGSDAGAPAETHDEAAAKPVPATSVVTPPPTVVAEAGHKAADNTSSRGETDLGMGVIRNPPPSLELLIVVLTSGLGLMLAAYSLRRLYTLEAQLSEHARITRKRLEHLVQALDSLQVLLGRTQSSVPHERSSKPPRRDPPPGSHPSTQPVKAKLLSAPASEDQLALLRALLTALHAHGVKTSTGTHLEVDVQHIVTKSFGQPLTAELPEQLSQLNLIASSSPAKPLREQNFLSIVTLRSGADNQPRRVVRVHKDAVPALEAFLSARVHA